MVKINCDLCGKVEEKFFKAIIEGVELNVCTGCSKFGKVLRAIKEESPKKPIKAIEPQEEKIELLVEDYAELVKKRREAMGLTQKDFAKKINEKESVIHKIETGMFEPPIYLVRKLEKMLGIKLVEEHHETRGTAKKSRVNGFTLGDFIQIKK